MKIPFLTRRTAKPRRETATTINDWAESEFGMIPFGMEGRAIERALEELKEVEDSVLCIDDSEDSVIRAEDALDELADVWIVLLRICGHFRYEPQAKPSEDMQDRIGRKMQKNRSRRWKPDGTGHKYHVKEP